MKSFVIKNWPLVVAFCLPFVLIFGIVASVYIPSLFIKTSYSFVYAVCDDQYDSYECTNYLPDYYQVIDGKLTKQTLEVSNTDNYRNDIIRRYNKKFPARFFIYSPETNQSTELTEDLFSTLTMSATLESPDMVRVNCGYNYSGNDFFFIFDTYHSEYACYLEQGNHRKKVPLYTPSSGYYRGNDVRFIGWIL